MGTQDHDESIRIIHRTLDSGVTFIDTADVYSAGESEIIVGKALANGTRRRRSRHQMGPISAARPQSRFDMSDPVNQRKLDAADALAQVADDAGITLIELRSCFVTPL